MILLNWHILHRWVWSSWPRGSTLALPVALLIVLALTACGFIGYTLWPTWPSAEVALDVPSLPITVAGTPFNIPPAAIRVPVPRQAGAHERVDLAFVWPSLEPPNLASPPVLQTTSPADGKAAIDRVFVTIAAAGDTLAPDDRVRTVYRRYASTTPVPGPEGLAVLAFRDATPYQGEDLIYDVATPANFLVRCSRAVGLTPGTCLLTRRIGGADIVVRFPRDWLDDWRFVAVNIERLIGSIAGT